MRSAKRTIKGSVVLALALLCFFYGFTQENSPYSRYGLGDIYPPQNIAARGMGGVSAAFASDQALNTVNPASYSALRFINVYGGSKGALVSYDFGLSIDSRNLRSADPAASYTSTNFLPSYIQLGIPLSAKAAARNRNTGLVFGLRPATRINYSIENLSRLSLDSVQTLYEGKGGLNQVFLGLGKRWGGLSLGFNAGYEFGSKEISTKLIFLNDSITYYKSNTSATTDFWGLFLSPGISYNIKLSEVQGRNNNYKDAYFLRLGASGTVEHKLDANTDNRVETFYYNDNTGTTTIDSIYEVKNQLGKITVPVTYNAGFMLSKKYMVGDNAIATKWSIGADYSTGKWTDYRFYNKPDQVINSWMIRAGGEYVPNVAGSSLFSRSTYRAGFYRGKDYINADGNGYTIQGFTFGLGFYLKRWTSYDNQSTLINTAIEFGKRGSNVNNITENFFKFSVGLSLADLWFTRRKYD